MIEAPAAPRPLHLPAASALRRIPSRAWWLACWLLLALLPFVTAPGEIIADSKLDLAVNPVGLLARALSLWDPQQFGQLQNQANGYLFPMGPFFALGRLADVPPWIVQRLWISAVLIAAFTGTALLAGLARHRHAVDTGGRRPRVRPVAHGAHVARRVLRRVPAAGHGPLDPRRSASSGAKPPQTPQSGGYPPPDTPRSPRELLVIAARSAVAVALCGGTNAACTVAACLPAVIYMLTRSAGRWRLLAWWTSAVVVATLWWSIPLVLLAKYGVSFLPYTESASATTSATSLDHALRGTENWISYLVVDGQAWWQAGYRIANQVLPTLLAGLATGLGLAGLIRRRMPERRFLILSVLAGLVIIAAGHPSLGNPLVGPVAAVINGPASAFRNLWKFDPLIRLPVALGLAHLLATVRVPRHRLMVVAAAGAGIGGLALPVYLSGLANPGSFSQIPSYWTAAADWLNARAGHQAVLLVPGMTFGQYDWGSPLDEVLQPLTTVDWAEQDLSLISSVGSERLLDAIDQRLADGAGSAGLTQVIARMGVKYVVVRNDLQHSVLQGAWPARVNQALASSPGMTEVATFGPLVGSAAPDDATNLDPPYPAVEIYQVGGAEPVAAVQPAAGTLRVYGAPESLLTLADEGLLTGRPVLLNGDGAGQPAAGSVLTDSLRRRVRNFGELGTSYSPTLTATQSADTWEATGDYLEPDWSQYLTVARYTGIKDVTASSSASDIGTIPGLWGSGLLPYAAVDGDLRTRWESGDWTGPVGQWLQLTFDAPVSPGKIRVTFVDNGAIGPPVSRVTVRTATGQVTDSVRATGAPQWLRVPAGASGWLRLTVTGLAWQPATALGTEVSISDILVPGVQAARTIVAPAVPGGDPAAVVLAKAQPLPSGCMLGSLGWACDPALATPTEEQHGFSHAFSLRSPERAVLSGSAVLADPSVADSYARLGVGQATVTASSVYTEDPQDQARSAFDGNPATTWIASSQDQRPALTVSWGKARTIRQVTIERPPGDTGLLQVLIAGSRGQARGTMLSTASGVVTFAPMRTTSMTFTFTSVQTPLQITDVVIPGVPFLTTPSLPFRLSCGLGPVIAVNGKLVPTRVSGTFEALLTGQPLRFTACSPVTLTAGANQVTEPSSDAFSVQDVVLSGHSPTSAQPSVAADIKSWTPFSADDSRGRHEPVVPGGQRELQRRVAGGHRRPATAGRAARRVEAGVGASCWYARRGDSDVRAFSSVLDRGRWRADLALAGGGRRGLRCSGASSRRQEAAPDNVPVVAAPPGGGGSAGGHRVLAWRLPRCGDRACGDLALRGGGAPGGSAQVLGGALLAVAGALPYARRRCRRRRRAAYAPRGDSGLVLTALDDAVPQVICLLVIARLAAALLLPSASKIEHVPVV